MARVVENEKEFKVIQISSKEMTAIGCSYVCDNCGEDCEGNGYYVAVLNRWFCPTCYKEWYEDNENYAIEGGADERIESKNFAAFLGYLAEAGIKVEGA